MRHRAEDTSWPWYAAQSSQRPSDGGRRKKVVDNFDEGHLCLSTVNLLHSDSHLNRPRTSTLHTAYFNKSLFHSNSPVQSY